MGKVKKVSLAMMTVLLFLSGCIQIVSSKKQEAIVDFVNEEVGQIAAIEEEAKQHLQGVLGDQSATDDDLYDVYVNNVIPLYKEALEKGKKIEPAIDELNEPHEILVSALESYLDAFETQVKAIEENDDRLTEKALLLEQEYVDLVDEYHKKMEELAKEHSVDYEANQNE